MLVLFYRKVYRNAHKLLEHGLDPHVENLNKCEYFCLFGFFSWSVDEVIMTTETHTHCKVPSSNPGDGVQPNNFSIAN